MNAAVKYGAEKSTEDRFIHKQNMTSLHTVHHRVLRFHFVVADYILCPCWWQSPSPPSLWCGLICGLSGGTHTSAFIHYRSRRWHCVRVPISAGARPKDNNVTWFVIININIWGVFIERTRGHHISSQLAMWCLGPVHLIYAWSDHSYSYGRSCAVSVSHWAQLKCHGFN